MGKEIYFVYNFFMKFVRFTVFDQTGRDRFGAIFLEYRKLSCFRGCLNAEK